MVNRKLKGREKVSSGEMMISCEISTSGGLTIKVSRNEWKRMRTAMWKC